MEVTNVHAFIPRSAHSDTTNIDFNKDCLYGDEKGAKDADAAEGGTGKTFDSVEDLALVRIVLELLYRLRRLSQSNSST